MHKKNVSSFTKIKLVDLIYQSIVFLNGRKIKRERERERERERDRFGKESIMTFIFGCFLKFLIVDKVGL